MGRGQQKALGTLTASTPYTCYGAKWVCLNIHESRATDRKFLASHTPLCMDRLLSGYSKTQISEAKLTNWTRSSSILTASCLVLNPFRSSMLPTTHLWAFLSGAPGRIDTISRQSVNSVGVGNLSSNPSICGKPIDSIFTLQSFAQGTVCC